MGVRPDPWLRALRPLPDPLGSAQIAVFVGLGDESAKLAITPDERRLVCGYGEDGAGVRIYDLAGSGQVVQSKNFPEGDEYLSSLTMSPRGDAIAVALGDGSLRLLDPDRLDEITRLIDGDGGENIDGLMDAIAFSPNGQFLVAGTWGGDLFAWDMETRKPLPSVRAHDDKVSAIAFAPDGSEFASGGANGRRHQLRRWRVQQTLQPLAAMSFDHEITSIVYATDPRLLLACTLYSEDVVVLDAAGKHLRTFHVDKGEHSECAAFTSDSQSLLAGAGDVFSAADVYCWDLKSGDLLWKLPGHNFLVQDLIVFDNGRRMVTAGDNTIRVWDLEKASRGSILNPLEPDIDHALFSRDGTIVFTASKKSETARARRLADGNLLHAWDGHEGGVHSVAASNDGKFACGCGSGLVEVWNVEDGSEWMTYSGHTAEVSALAFSPDGRLLATGAHDGTAHLLSVASRKRLTTFDHWGWLKVVRFSPDARFLLTGEFTTLIVWDVKTRKKHSQFEGKSSTYYDACFTDDAADVVMQGVGDELTAWNVRSGSPVPLQDVHRQAMNELRMYRPGHWSWDEPKDPETTRGEVPELTMRRADTNMPVAWLQLPHGEILHHPTRDIWGVRRGGHLHVFALEQV